MIELGTEIFFEDDPDSRIRDAKTAGYWITSNSLFDSDHLGRKREAKQRLRDDLEALRQANREAERTEQAQANVERTGYLQAQFALLERYISDWEKENPNMDVLLTGVPLLEDWRDWHQLGGAESDFIPFFLSEHFHALPVEAIPSVLNAELLTQGRPIQKSDSMDIHHMTVALPTASWILTDRFLSGVLAARALDRQWDAKVFSLASVEHLLCELRGLGD